MLNSKIKARKCPNQKKIDLRVFCEKLSFDSLFLVNLNVFPGLLQCEKKGLERSLDDVGFVPNLNINVENLPCLGFWKSLYVHKIKPAYACRKLRTQADLCVRIARVSFGFIFQKLIYLLIKSYISHFNTSQVNLTFNQALNQPQVLEFSIIGE